MQSWHRGSFIAHRMISWTADHRSLSAAEAALTRHVESARENADGDSGQREAPTWHGHFRGAATAELPSAAYQPCNSETGGGGGQRADAMLAQRWRDQIRIWKQELFIDLLAVNLSQNHSPISFNFLPFPLYSLYKPPQDWGWKNGWEWLWLGMSHAHREPSTQALYVAVWRAAPSPLCCSSTPQRLPFSLGRAEGEVGPLLSRGILRGDCKACDCVGLYFCGEKEGAKREKERARGRQRGVAEESWDTDSLVKQQPQRARARGGGEKGKSQEENGTSRKTKRSSLDYVTSVILLLCLCFPLLLLIRSLHLAPCTPALQVYNKFCPHPHPSSLNSHPPHYITRIPLTRGLREMSGVAAVIISALFTSQLYFTI